MTIKYKRMQYAGLSLSRAPHHVPVCVLYTFKLKTMQQNFLERAGWATELETHAFFKQSNALLLY